MANKDINGKLKLSTKLGYGMGDIFGGGSITVVTMYYMIFLTDVAGISPYLIAIIFPVNKIWSAIADPLIGILSDRTRTRMGRRRPYFLAGMFMIILSFFIMWFPVRTANETLKFFYYLFTFLVYSTTFSLVWVPYTALASEMTEDYDERTKLATYRMVFSGLASIVCATLPMVIVKQFGDIRIGYMVMSLAFALFFALPYIMTIKTTFEREDFHKDVSHIKFGEFVKANFLAPFRLKPFRLVALMYLTAFVATDIIMVLLAYFMTYYMRNKGLMSLLTAVVFGLMPFIIPLIEMLALKIGKRGTFIAAACLWILSFLYTFTIHPGSSTPMLVIFGVMFSIATAGIHVMVFAIFPDIPDVDELISGQRREGVFSGLFSFLRKVGSGIALSIVPLCIGLAGYVKPIQTIVGGQTKLIEQAQTGAVITTIRLLFGLLPIALACIALLICIMYPVTREAHARLRTYLDKKRAGETGPDMDAEAEWLKAKLL